jgi:hypothetical protein
VWEEIKQLLRFEKHLAQKPLGGKAGKQMYRHSVAKLQVPPRDSVGVSLNSLDHQDVGHHISTYISRK